MASTTGATSEIASREFPATGSWQVDSAHTSISFVVKHMMMAKVRGHFDTYKAQLEIGEAPGDSSVAVSVEVASLTTGISQRDDHLRSPDFFDVENHPTMTFRSTSFEPDDEGQWELTGDLTIREVTRPIRLDVEFNGVGTDPWGSTRIAFSARGKLQREDFGLTWNQALESGGWLVGKDVTIEIELEATLA
jgi:polyisoprenoid-binding protein YceI